MFEFGVVVDSSSVDRMERVEEFDSLIISEVSEYKIVGISLLYIKNTQIELDMDCEDDNASDLIGSKLKVVRFYNKARRLLSSMYCIRDFSSSIDVEIDNCLPVYSEKGESLFSCNGNKFKCKCAMGLGLVVDVTSLDMHLDSYDNISPTIHCCMLYNRKIVPFNEISCLIDISINGIYKTHDLCYIYESIDEFIVPSCCRTLILADSIDIDKLVLNFELCFCEIPSDVEIITLYISKDTNNVVACQIIYHFVSKYMCKPTISTVEIYSYNKYYNEISRMIDHSEYDKLWMYLHSKECKRLLDRVLQDTNIVVY